MVRKRKVREVDVEKWAIDDSVEFLPKYLENTEDITPMWEAAIKWNPTKIISILVNNRKGQKFWKTICKEKRGAAIRFYLRAHAINHVELDRYHGHELSLEMRRFILTIGFEVPLGYETVSSSQQSDLSFFFHLTVGGHCDYNVYSFSPWFHHLCITPFSLRSSSGCGDKMGMDLYCLYDNAMTGNPFPLFFNGRILASNVHLLLARNQLLQQRIDQLLFHAMTEEPLETYLLLASWGMKPSEELEKKVDEIFSSLLLKREEQKIDHLLSIGVYPTYEYCRMMDRILNRK